jgi:ribose transport system ATP-binding protein
VEPESAAGDGFVIVRQATKSFSGIRALSNVGLDVDIGEIHALVGANGSGKSTLIKAMSGVQPCDPAGGSMVLGGQLLDLATATPERASAVGVLAVHQEATIFPHLTVAENLAHGVRFSGASHGRIRWRTVRSRASEILDKFELNIGPDALGADLSPAMRSMVAIARVLSTAERTTSLLILDEPTAMLPPREVEVLHDHLRRHATSGQAILYVSHRLDEVMALCDRISVLRDGANAGTFRRGEVDTGLLAQRMFGEEIATRTRTGRVKSARVPVLELDRVAGGGVAEVSFSVHPGEVVGLIGLADSGVNAVTGLVSGQIARRSGTVRVGGSALPAGSVAAAQRSGVGHVSGDLVSTVFRDHTVEDNLSIVGPGRYRTLRGLSHRRIRSDACATIERFGVVCGGPDALMSSLSGGNQQKVVLARSMALQPSVLVVEDPTAGVDVGARASIYQLLSDALDDGLAILMTSSDLDELALLCDRVLVIRDGTVVAETDDFDRRDLTVLLYSQGVAS